MKRSWGDLYTVFLYSYSYPRPRYLAGVQISFGLYGIIYLHVVPMKVSNYLRAYRVYNISSNSSHQALHLLFILKNMIALERKGNVFSR